MLASYIFILVVPVTAKVAATIFSSAIFIPGAITVIAILVRGFVERSSCRLEKGFNVET
jgi:hypothetical protein